ncbi:DNA-processing protein DprA [Candidatus Parcubacteria bacterium]|nr:DNA-processing protein DprA [Candidatus Parcubacteria bacterium]
MFKNNDDKFLIALNHFPKFGPIRMKKISKYFSSFEHAFKANLDELKASGIKENIANEFIVVRSNIDIEKLIDIIQKENIKICKITDDDYPRLLKEIYDPPYFFYYKGSIDNINNSSIGVVGARKYTNYGERTIEKIVYNLAKNNLNIISGLALGIDALAHNTCLNAKGKTIAVLGTGIDKQSLYPFANRYLAEKIITAEGAIISEFPLGTEPLRYNFPQRNRIISGLSFGTLVVEAAEKSGALITARCACEQNREVFAVPGSIFSDMSIGPNELIKQGAKPVTKADDILEILDLKNVNNYIDNTKLPLGEKIIAESEEEKVILEHLSLEAIHIDELIRLTKLNTSTISSTLIILEMKGAIKNLGNMQYILL